MAVRGRCLASQEIRKLIGLGGVLEGEINESRIQPSSFEPVIGNEGYILDAEEGLFRPHADKTVMRSLLELPSRKRQRVDLSGGFELKQGSSYLFPLEGAIRSGGSINFIKSSPKSSIGRVFPSTRLVTDFNSSFDEINHFPGDKYLKSWLLVQPLASNLIVGPGLSFNQLRFFNGYDAQLTPSEIVREWKKNPLLFSKSLEGKLGDPISPVVSESLQLHLDLEGRDSHGIVALRARANPNPIDLRKKGYCAEDYFEPLKPEKGSLIIKPGEHYLVASKEVLNIPVHLNAELKAHSHQGIRGTLHEAGFVDNGFCGDLVFEVTSEEPTDVHLIDGMPIGELTVYRTQKPDKIYGTDIGSHYAMQTGPKVAKYFLPFDFARAARDHARLNRDVLVQDKGLLSKLHQGDKPFALVREGKRIEKIFETVEKGFFHSRYDCEGDNMVLQPVPYIVVFDETGRVFSYVRSNSATNNLGDVRLHGKGSIGVGGHIRREDVPDYVRNCVNRELGKDISVDGGLSRPKFLGTLYCHGEDVDDYHFGLIFGAVAKGRVSPRDSAIVSSQMIPIDSFECLKDGYETWSKVLIPHLGDIYQRSKK